MPKPSDPTLATAAMIDVTIIVKPITKRPNKNSFHDMFLKQASKIDAATRAFIQK